MKRTNQLTIGAAVLLLLLAGAEWKPLQKWSLRDSCTSSGGKWAENHGYCIEKNCAENSSCLPSYGNNAACKTLTPGITASEAYFHLGMPKSINGVDYTFEGGALSQEIHAIIKDGKVERLQCGT